jgi:hypothetical protein
MGVTMKSHETITFQLVRDTNDSSKDDTITIRQTTDSDIIFLSYKDRKSNSFHEVRMTKRSMSEYCISLFHILSYDEDPFIHVQVNFPAFPSVLLKADDLQDNLLRDRLQSMLWFTMEQSFNSMEVAAY